MRNMSYDVFCTQMQEKLQKVYGEDAHVKLHCVQKVNGVLLRGITIMKDGRNIMPTLYLEHYYDKYEDGMPLHEIVRIFMQEYEKSCIYEDFDIDFFEKYELVKPHLGYKLINYEMNWQLLQEVPHKCYLDLAVVCYCDIVDDRIGKGSILIRNEHLKMWELEERQLLKDAMENMMLQMPADLLNMSTVLKELYHDSEELIVSKLPMYVLTNRGKVYGAGSLLYPEQLEWIAKEVDDDYYLLPSSIHEIIILPKKFASDEKHLSHMVDEINNEQLDREEILSNHAYLYTRLTKEITLLPQVPYRKETGRNEK